MESSRTLARTPKGEAIAFQNNAAADALAAVNPDDLNDLLGNLLENAARAAKSTVEISARNEGLKVLVEISDDGADMEETSFIIARRAWQAA